MEGDMFHAEWPSDGDVRTPRGRIEEPDSPPTLKTNAERAAAELSLKQSYEKAAAELAAGQRPAWAQSAIERRTDEV